MDFAIIMVIGLVVILTAWWVRIPDPPGTKFTQMLLGVVGAAAMLLFFGGAIYALCSWMSSAVGHQPLHM